MQLAYTLPLPQKISACFFDLWVTKATISSGDNGRNSGSMLESETLFSGKTQETSEYLVEDLVSGGVKANNCVGDQSVYFRADISKNLLGLANDE